jgi:cytochrome c oxidase assembly protein subunit 15
MANDKYNPEPARPVEISWEATPLVPILGGAVISVYILMVVGAFVTSTGSGLACPDWPLCYGSVRPPLRLDIWFEWGHRLLGGLTGILIITSSVLVWRSYRGLPRYFMAAVVGFLCLTVLVGGIVVLTEAPLLDSLSRVAIVSSHLVISTLVLVFLVFTLSYVLKNGTVSRNRVYALLFGMVYVQVILGILVRYSGATLACPDFPLCNGRVIPHLTHYPVALHYFHRVFALLVFITSAAALLRAIRSGKAVLGFLFTFALVVLQVVFGILVVLTGMFLPVIILHGAPGFLLMGWLAYQSMPYFFPTVRKGYVEVK